MKRFYCFLLSTVWVGCCVSAETPVDWSTLHSEAKRLLKLSNCSVRALALPEVTTNADGARRPVEISTELDGTVETLCLQPHSLRSPDFKLFVQRGKALVQEVPPPPATWRGHVRGRPGSTVTAAIHDGEMQAVVNMPGKPSWIVESLGRAMPHAPKGAHVIHRSDASLPVAGRCGVVAPVGKAPASQAGTPAPGPQGAPAGAMPVNFAYAEIAFDADVEYYFGTVAGTMAHIESLINAVDVIYARDVQIGYIVTAMVIRTQEPDPYTQEGSSALLTEFKNFWNSQMSSIRRDVAHLLTGRDLSGAGPEIGLGYQNVICNSPTQSYALSGNYIVIVPGFTREVIVMAHELGHNWGAEHCGVTECGIMAETGVLLADYFSETSKAQIIAHRLAHPQCLTSGQIYVDWRATAPFWGTALHPFRTLAEGLPAVPAAGSLILRGVHQYPENLTIHQALTLKAEEGAVTLGQ